MRRWLGEKTCLDKTAVQASLVYGVSSHRMVQTRLNQWPHSIRKQLSRRTNAETDPDFSFPVDSGPSRPTGVAVVTTQAVDVRALALGDRHGHGVRVFLSWLRPVGSRRAFAFSRGRARQSLHVAGRSPRHAGASMCLDKVILGGCAIPPSCAAGPLIGPWREHPAFGCGRLQEGPPCHLRKVRRFPRGVLAGPLASLASYAPIIVGRRRPVKGLLQYF